MRVNDVRRRARTVSATVTIREWSAAYYGQAKAGKGTLYYNGGSHHFTISGGGLGGSGVQKVSATGKVYNLNNLSSFSGTYHGVSRGLTLIEGKMHAKLTNQNGVVMYIAGQTEGLASSLGAQAFRFKFNQLTEEAAKLARCLSQNNARSIPAKLITWLRAVARALSF